jgi:hypothetical protein
MRGPIDYIVVEFIGNNFKGEILDELTKATDSGAIAVLDIALITKDDEGVIGGLELSSLDNDLARTILGAKTAETSLITKDDVAEVGELLDKNSTAGLLIVEQLWAKGLKQALINADGILLAEGRIHPDALQELDQKEEN